jgi:hypothetical protein
MATFFAKNGGQDPNSISTTASASLDTSRTASMDVDLEKLEREAVDFFGRTIGGNKEGEGSATLGSSLDGSLMTTAVRPKKKTRIWYKFNEGFSNAVKAKVFINELL